MVSDPDATIPVPKPVSAPADGVTPSQVGNLLAAGVGAFDTRPASVGGRGWEPPSVEVLQALLPQYEITAFLARGGMGAVYKGMQRALKRPVAIKVLPPEIQEGGDELQFAARFKQEAQAMARLSHPNIVAVFDAGEVVLRETGRLGEGETVRPGEGEVGRKGATLLYFVMEFIEGTDVAQLIASEGPLDAARVVPIIAAVCEALAFAHDEGIVHRDIKPSNIMIDRRGRVKVADFGLAKAVNIESTLITRSDVAMGTPDFVAPEALIPGMKVDGRADLYAVGVMLYQMLTGKIPRGRFELPSGIIPQVDHRFDAIVDRAMQTDREKRYPTATEMKREVESVVMVKEGSAGSRSAASQPARSAPDGVAGATKKAGRSARAPFLLAAAAVVVLGAGGWMLMQKPAEGGAAVAAGLPAPASKAGTALKLWTAAGQLPRNESITWENGVITLRNTSLRHEVLMRNVVFRASVLMEPGANTVDLQVRSQFHRDSSDPLRASWYGLGLVSDHQGVMLKKRVAGEPRPMVKAWKLPRTYQNGEWLPLEIKMVGSQMAVSAGGKLLGTVTDADLLHAGGVAISSTEVGRVRDVEVINLDGLSEAEALKAAGLSAPAPLSWLKSNFATEAPGNVVDGRLRITGFGALMPDKKVRPGDVVVRTSLVWSASTSSPKLNTRYVAAEETGGQKPTTAWFARFSADAVSVGVTEDKDRSLKTVKLTPPIQPGDKVTLQFASIGQRHLAWVNEKLVADVTDGQFVQKGPVRLSAGEALFDSLEYLPLDGLSDAEALKAAGIEAAAPEPIKPVRWVDATEEVKRNGLEQNLLSVEGDWLIAKGGINYFSVSGTRELADAAVRVVFRGRVQVKLRQQPASEKFAGYIAIGDGRSGGIGFTGTDTGKEWLKPDLDLGQSYQPDEDHELIFAAHGNQLIYAMEGRLIARVQDARFEKGKIELATLMDQANDPNPTRVKKVEYMSLDGLSESEALKAAGIEE